MLQERLEEAFTALLACRPDERRPQLAALHLHAPILQTAVGGVAVGAEPR